MAVTEDDIARVLKLIPTCTTVDTVGCLMENNELGLTKDQIYEALHVLEGRGQVTGRELFDRDLPQE